MCRLILTREHHTSQRCHQRERLHLQSPATKEHQQFPFLVNLNRVFLLQALAVPTLPLGVMFHQVPFISSKTAQGSEGLIYDCTEGYLYFFLCPFSVSSRRLLNCFSNSFHVLLALQVLPEDDYNILLFFKQKQPFLTSW